jgi:uncharacterized protein with NRDE domain
MCLVVVAMAAHPSYALVVAANRDEFHERPTAPAAWWPEGWLGGRDLRADGTWFGVTRRGRFAFVTNVREPGRNDPAAPSRGELVPAVLADARTCDEAVAALATTGRRYNGYNLVAGEPGRAWWSSNRHANAAPVVLETGITGISNAALGTPWPKVVATNARVAAWCASGATNLDPLFEALADRRPARDDELPATGVSPEWERLLSAPFIVSERYGTRASTVLAIAHDGEARFIEQAFDSHGTPTGRVDMSFRLAPSP